MTATTPASSAMTERHELKTDPEVFAAVMAGAKTHEIRLNDRGFHIGDELLLRETANSGAEMKAGAPLAYTGREATRAVSHIQTGYGLANGWCILSFASQPVAAAPAAQAAAIPTWKERLFAQQPDARSYPTGVVHDIGASYKDEEIADLRAALQQRQAPAQAWTCTRLHDLGTVKDAHGELIAQTYYKCAKAFTDAHNAAIAQHAEAAPVASAEPIYQARTIKGAGWHDVSRDVYDFVEPTRRRIVYNDAVSQAAPAPVAAVPSNEQIIAAFWKQTGRDWKPDTMYSRDNESFGYFFTHGKIIAAVRELLAAPVASQPAQSEQQKGGA